ncbi:MAG: DUF1810 domain-containing protein [Pirellulaceae bacterium]
MPADPFEHFLTAQANTHSQALRELSSGRKRTHWMWFIFPQLAGLGQSAMARRYAISSVEMAAEYLRHPELGPRLRACTEAVLNQQETTADEIFGTPDNLKFHSSMTLFHLAAPTDELFTAALEKYFGGVPDPNTLELLGLGDLE